MQSKKKKGGQVTLRDALNIGLVAAVEKYYTRTFRDFLFFQDGYLTGANDANCGEFTVSEDEKLKIVGQNRITKH